MCLNRPLEDNMPLALYENDVVSQNIGKTVNTLANCGMRDSTKIVEVHMGALVALAQELEECYRLLNLK